MRKGEARRQEILNAAEELFLSRGYDATSVQDVLEALHISKGGFYHHFATKEDVLRCLVAQRAERAAAYAADALDAATDGMGRLNAVLRGFTPLRREEAAFMRMLTPFIERSEGRAMAMLYQDALMAHFQPLLRQEVASAAADGTVFPPVRGMEEAVLQLVNCCWITALTEVSRARREGGPIDAALLLTALERYRRAVEVLLDAPYGSVELLRVEELMAVAEVVRG
ncbi:MAG: TetR/AcrR family transcriptional regulator [Clostridia bacterium]|nr:TetR/AcrR family transcriptional regulator [Clostridia bacterium]